MESALQHPQFVLQDLICVASALLLKGMKLFRERLS